MLPAARHMDNMSCQALVRTCFLISPHWIIRGQTELVVSEYRLAKYYATQKCTHANDRRTKNAAPSSRLGLIFYRKVFYESMKGSSWNSKMNSTMLRITASKSLHFLLLQRPFNTFFLQLLISPLLKIAPRSQLVSGDDESVGLRTSRRRLDEMPEMQIANSSF